MDPSDPESHKNEGFLKSMWHTFTNHPAHQKSDGANDGKGGPNSSENADKKDTKEKPSDDEKKP